MNPEEEKTNQSECTPEECQPPCCSARDVAEKMAECCPENDETSSCCSMMAKCMSKCKWCPLIPVIVGVLLFIAGYFLSAEIVRVLWLIVSGLIILTGILCFVMIRTISCK